MERENMLLPAREPDECCDGPRQFVVQHKNRWILNILRQNSPEASTTLGQHVNLVVTQWHLTMKSEFKIPASFLN